MYDTTQRSVFTYTGLYSGFRVDLFQWYTIPGVAIASFIYLGFLAAGEEIEQPFGEHACHLSTDVLHPDM